MTSVVTQEWVFYDQYGPARTSRERSLCLLMLWMFSEFWLLRSLYYLSNGLLSGLPDRIVRGVPRNWRESCRILSLLYDLRALLKMKGITGSPLSGCPFDTQRVTLYALVALLVFVCSIPIFGQSRTIELSPSNPELSINDPGYLHDSGKTHSIQDLLDTSSVAQFRQISASEPGYVDTIKHYWIRFTVLNTDSVDREWVFNFDGWSKVYAYCRQAGGRVSEYVTGHLVPISQRNYPTGNANNILVLLKANSSSTYYVSLESLPDHVIRPTDLSFEVSSRTFRDQRDHRDRQKQQLRPLRQLQRARSRPAEP
jgi:hypothetical protein